MGALEGLYEDLGGKDAVLSQRGCECGLIPGRMGVSFSEKKELEAGLLVDCQALSS